MEASTEEIAELATQIEDYKQQIETLEQGGKHLVELNQKLEKEIEVLKKELDTETAKHA